MAPKTQEKDFDQAPQTVEQVQEQTRLYMERYNSNSVKISGTIREKYVSDSKPKIDKKTNEHIVVDGVPQFWEPFRSLTISFDGGEMQINVDKDMFDSSIVGKRYLFEGVKGMIYGKVQDRFHSMLLL